MTEVDLETGSAKLVSGAGAFQFPTGMALSSLGELFVADNNRSIFEIDLVTGTQATVGTDLVEFEQIKDMVFNAGGDLLLSTRFRGVHRVDPVGCSILETFSGVTGNPRQMDLELFGDLLYADAGANMSPVLLDLGSGVPTPFLPPSFQSIRGMPGLGQNRE